MYGRNYWAHQGKCTFCVKVPGIDLIMRYPIMIFLEGIEFAAV